MTKQTEFQKQLSDPRWQKKRLEILERDEWTCQTCGDTKATLTVHHKSYRMTDGKFADVWDYKGGDLITLCNQCHEQEEWRLTGLQKTLFFSMRDLFDNAENISMVLRRLSLMKNEHGRITCDDFIIVRSSVKDDAALESLFDYLLDTIEVKK